ncbi:MAG: type II secretion system F family protein [Chloroflexi bacterium]|nr:type II secretion system F family protein [Chloroflexota bacterium]
MTFLIPGIIIVLAVIIIGVVVLVLPRTEQDPLMSRINEYASREEIASIEEIELSMPMTDRIFVPIMRRLSTFVIRMTPQSSLERTARMLELAGSPRNMTAANFWVLRGVATLVLSGLTFLVMWRFGAEPGKRFLYALGAAVLGFFLPVMLLQSMIDRRKQSIVKKFPDALDLMTICVDAGLIFDAAMQKVHEKWDDALAREFGRVTYELQLGKSRRQALKDMSDRMDLSDVTSFVATILQAEQLGVSIGKVLRIQSEQMRIKRRQRAEEKAQQAPIKMLFPMIFLIFPSMFVVLLGPAILRVIRTDALRSISG